jgi:hypothetical protein
MVNIRTKFIKTNYFGVVLYYVFKFIRTLRRTAVFREISFIHTIPIFYIAYYTISMILFPFGIFFIAVHLIYLLSCHPSIVCSNNSLAVLSEVSISTIRRTKNLPLSFLTKIFMALFAFSSRVFSLPTTLHGPPFTIYSDLTSRLSTSEKEKDTMSTWENTQVQSKGVSPQKLACKPLILLKNKCITRASSYSLHSTHLKRILPLQARSVKYKI